MPAIRVLSEADLRQVVGLDQSAVDCIEQAFRALATEAVVMPPILHLPVKEANGEVDVKTAHIPGSDSFTIKMSSGFFDNPKIGLSTSNGLMVVFSAKTGHVEALLLDNGYLTDLRTAAAGAVGAKWLARADASRAGIIGSGQQAQMQLEALTLVRPIAEARVWARDAGNAAAYAETMSERLAIPVTACAEVAEVCTASDIVVTTTPSTEPMIESAHLHSGLHITAMGSDAPYKCEIAPEALASVDRYVCDRLTQCAALGELHRAVEAGAISAGTVFPELGQVIAGLEAGRTSDNDITLFDSTGTGAQDTAIAALARHQAGEAGTMIES